MIIDCNASLGHWPFRRLAHADADGILSLMDQAGVTQAWIGALEGIFYRDMAAANRLLQERIAGHEDRLNPWAVINPAFPGWEDDVQEAHGEGFCGLRLYPNYHGYGLGDGCVGDLMGAAAALHWPVAIYHKVQDERLHHWCMVVPPTDLTPLPDLLTRFPHLPVLLFGQGWQMAQAMGEKGRWSNLYMDISRCEGVAGVAAMVAGLGPERVLMGSHAPLFYLDAALLKVQEGGLEPADCELVLHGNAARLMADQE